MYENRVKKHEKLCLKKRKLRKNKTALFRDIKGSHREEGQELFSVAQKLGLDIIVINCSLLKVYLNIREKSHYKKSKKKSV